ncbi:hypothetical protein Tco_0542791, partial [Tanacetum coccineum]
MIHLHIGGSYYSFPCSILSTRKDRKTPQRYPDVPTTSRRISLRSMDSFQGLTLKSPLSWHRHLALMVPTTLSTAWKIQSKLFVDYASSRTDETRSRQFAMNQGPRSFNEAANAWKGKPNFNWAHTQTFTSPQNGSFSTYSSNYQTKIEKALIDFDSHQEKRLSSLKTQLGQQQDDMISKINLLWKTVSKKLDDIPIHNTAGSPAAQMNFTSMKDPIKEELQG